MAVVAADFGTLDTLQDAVVVVDILTENALDLEVPVY